MNVDELAVRFADMGQAIAALPGPERVAAVTRMAVDSLHGVSSASITLLEQGRYRTVAATDEIAVAADLLQYGLESGPCVDAVTGEAFLAPERLADDQRWPEFGPVAASHDGIGSMLSYRLIPPGDHVTASLNLYASTAVAFDDDDKLIGTLVATHAGSALAASLAERRIDGLRESLKSNRDIGVAMGVLMQQRKITRDAAFDLLRIASQHTNRKLRDLATEVADTGELGLPG